MIDYVVAEAFGPFPVIQLKASTAVPASAQSAGRKATVGDPLCIRFGAPK
jgi:hypothetical protein